MSTSPVRTPYVEPWLRGTYPEVPAVGRAVLHAFDLALDDLTKWTEGLTDAEVHTQPLGLPSVAFHLRHIARSTDRLLTYAEGWPTHCRATGIAQSGADWGRILAELLGEVEASSRMRRPGCARWPQRTSTSSAEWAASSCRPASGRAYPRGRSHAEALSAKWSPPPKC